MVGEYLNRNSVNSENEFERKGRSIISCPVEGVIETVKTFLSIFSFMDTKCFLLSINVLGSVSDPLPLLRRYLPPWCDNSSAFCPVPDNIESVIHALLISV